MYLSVFIKEGHIFLWPNKNMFISTVKLDVLKCGSFLKPLVDVGGTAGFNALVNLRAQLLKYNLAGLIQSDRTKS